MPQAFDNQRWWSISREGEVLGVVGYDIFENKGCLHSLAVLPSVNRTGIGQTLVFHVLSWAYQNGVRDTFLFTDNPRDYFGKWGFRTMSREAVPGVFVNNYSENAYAMQLTLNSIPLLIRPAQASDAEALASIYNQAIEERIATFETEVRNPGERILWLKNRDARFPVLVAETIHGVVGWLSLNPFSTREVYRYVADISIYVSRDMRSKRVGRRLLNHGIRTAYANNFHKLVLTLFPFNTPARRLYLNEGFQSVGILHEQAQLDGKWIDTEIMERILLTTDGHV